MNGGLNTYGYVGGNPLSYTDPTGEVWVPAADGGFTVPNKLPPIPKWLPRTLKIGKSLTPLGALTTIAMMCMDSEDDKEKKCEENLDRDLETCSALGKRDGKSAYKICEGQAYARYSRCLQGSDITPPLPPWGTK